MLYDEVLKVLVDGIPPYMPGKNEFTVVNLSSEDHG